MRGRITALWTTAFVGSTPIGAVIIGAVAHWLGGRAALGIGAAACLVAVLVGLITFHAIDGRRSHHQLGHRLLAQP